jgi:hypothetical protein
MAMLGRRTALGLGAAALIAGRSRAHVPGFVSAAATAAGEWRVAGFGLDGAGHFELPIPGRGHGAAIAPDGGTAVVFGRRPGAFAQEIDVGVGRPLRMLPRAAGRWFCGHGVFAADGTLLYATEIDDQGEGVVGVYAPGRGFVRIGEFPTHGADPHDIRLLADGRTLVVANGGIRADPALPRARFDLDAIDSALVHIDAASGARLAAWRLHEEALRLLSLRHLAIAGDGAVFVAMQHEGPRDEAPPLAAVQRGGHLATLDGDLAAWGAMDHYTGSAAASRDGRLIAVSSPRGGQVALLDAATGAVAARIALPDGCGLAAAPGGGFVATSGLGRALLVGSDAPAVPLPSGWIGRLRWDNHLAPIGAS